MFIDFLSDFYGKTRPRTKRNPLGIKKPRPKLEPESLNWEVEHQIIPVELYREPKRTGWRYSFGKNNVLLVRIPKLDNAEEAKLLEEVQLRLTERMKQKPELYDFFNQKKYYNDTIVNVGNREYTVKIFIEARKSCTGRLLVKKEGKIIDIRADAYLEEAVRQKTIGKLISRIVAADFLPEFSRRVDELNDRYFQQDIKNITFKNNHSNWGSCSSSNNLNFSSRLLFAPQIVQDYVIIHELAHLIELNHSDRFWDLVAKVMPDYEDQEMWLKLNAAACRF
jgi:predicted metal-dependent hydrolase